jgi:N1221-like protein/Domain of unknown function (DUF3402)
MVKFITIKIGDSLTPRSSAMPIKSSPLDIETFRQETSVKYPTFTPPQQPVYQQPMASSLSDSSAPRPTPSLLTSKLAQAYSPIPVRHHYHHDDSDSHSGLPPNPHHGNLFHPQQQPTNGYRQNPQPATPAPSPPPSPKPKKQQYQTDQNRPFLFPFSKGRFGYKDTRLVPFAIDEADKLYNKHMYISLALSQMWRTREDCMTAESGLDHMPGSEGEFEPSTVTPAVCTLLSGRLSFLCAHALVAAGYRYSGAFT